MSHDPQPENPRELTGRRVERAVYVASNERGAEVRIGGSDTEAAFTPGELLQIAAAACAALSADHVLSSRLGETFDASFTVDGDGVKGENRYEKVTTKVVVDMSALEQQRQEALIERAAKTIERRCSVGRTLETGAATQVDIIPDH